MFLAGSSGAFLGLCVAYGVLLLYIMRHMNLYSWVCLPGCFQLALKSLALWL